MSATSTEILADDICILAAAMRRSGVASLHYHCHGEVHISLDLVANPPPGLLSGAAQASQRQDNHHEVPGPYSDKGAQAAGGKVISFPPGGQGGLASVRAHAAEVQ